jgi:hypothetical protein
MRKTLLIAASALAASVISSQAGVYSQNVVGYANSAATSSTTYFIDIPFLEGVSNGANEIWPLNEPSGTPTLPDGSSLLIWNGSGYTGYLSDSGSPSLWDDSGGNPLTYSPILPVGQGMFLIPAGNVTNTFAGTVAVNVGTSNSVTLISSVTYALGCVVPYAGYVTNGNPVTGAGGPNLWNPPGAPNGIPDGSSLLEWNGTGYTGYLSDSGSASFWDDSGGNPLAAPPSISVGQGFFLVPAATFKWTVGL